MTLFFIGLALILVGGAAALAVRNDVARDAIFITLVVAGAGTASVPAFGALLRNIARLNGSAGADRATATREGARAADLPDGLVASIIALERPSTVKAVDAARLFPEYLAAVEQLARYVDSWRV